MRMKSFFRSTIMRFSKWTHKGYGVFESIRNVVNIGVLPVSFCLLAMPMATFAQTDSVTVSKNVDIEEVVVNARKKASTYSELTRVVRIVSRDELGQRKATSLGELLEQVAAIDIRQRGTHGVQADINLRGGTFDQVLVLLNGINISDPQTGHHNLNIPINLDAVERVEILQGPGAREFGPGAFAGAINIITKPNEANRGQLSVFAAEHGLIKTSVSQNLSRKKIKTFIAASYDKSDGYIDNTDFRRLNLYTHSTYNLSKGEVYLFAGYQDKGFGANSFYTPKFPNQYEATKAMLGTIGYNLQAGELTLKTAAYYRKHTDRFELFRDNPASWYAGHNYHATDIYGIKVSGNRIYTWGKTDLGFEFRREEILSNKLGTALVDSVKAWGEDAYYTMGDSRNNLLAYISQTIYLNDFAFSAGGQYNHSNKFGTNWTWGIDLSYGLTSIVRPFASINRSFRLPTFTDLFYQGPTNIGNPNLKAEYATTYEGGVKLNYKLITLESALFYRQGRDIIDWVKAANESVWTTTNYTTLNTLGASLFVTINTRDLNILTDKISISYSYADNEKPRGELDSYYALDNLKHNLSISGYHNFLNGLYLNWTLRFQERYGEYLKYIDATTSIPAAYPSALLMDTRFGYENKRYNIYIDVANVFDDKYVDIANVTQPGRWIGVGVNYNFNF